MSTQQSQHIASDRFVYTWKNSLLIVLLMFAMSFLCLFMLVVSVDQACVSLANTWIPSYPDSEVISEDYTNWRPFGVGTSRRVIDTDDPVNEVRNWYNRTRRAAGTTPPSGLAIMSFSIREHPDGDGSRVVLSSQCGWSAPILPDFEG